MKTTGLLIGTMCAMSIFFSQTAYSQTNQVRAQNCVVTSIESLADGADAPVKGSPQCSAGLTDRVTFTCDSGTLEAWTEVSSAISCTIEGNGTIKRRTLIAAQLYTSLNLGRKIKTVVYTTKAAAPYTTNADTLAFFGLTSATLSYNSIVGFVF